MTALLHALDPLPNNEPLCFQGDRCDDLAVQKVPSKWEGDNLVPGTAVDP